MNAWKRPMSQFDLKDQELTVAEIHRNIPPSALYEHAIRHDRDSSIAETRITAKKPAAHQRTGVVKNAASERDVWWGPGTSRASQAPLPSIANALRIF